ncbi:mediator of RNA polymerase II transcription subunit 13 [Drosophila pseudoobscura]|uniref:Mediator of RNA polymerase II transcription subunit 13 n=1 Tax=Drosophila pseudoobscura pseudoobscura TaxID=46245 RepID=A0A6I8UFN2_DROPS|nr:mediator of RNA polymerase II transcription subunit 13 [Drosophila pseudoobscura]
MTSNRIWLVLPLAMMLATLILAKSSVQAAPVEEVDVNVDKGQSQSQSQNQLSSTLEKDRQRIDCKLTFDAATMGSLGCHDEMDMGQEVEAAVAESGASSTANKPVQLQRHLKSPDSQPIYELQLVVWPSDIEDGDDFNPLEDSTTTTTTTTKPTPTTTTTPTPTPTPTTTITPPTTTTATQIWPLYEDQLAVFPQMDFEEENLDYFLDEPVPAPAPPSISSTTARPRPIDPTGTTTPTPTYVVEHYHVIHPNGTEEYKLVLSNGLANYKKLYTKRVGEQLINVQEGYNSVPIAGRRNLIQTQYFIADERGYNVYKIEQNYHQPGLPKHLHYKATKPSNM